MAQVGQVIEHPLTGERVTFLETAASTDGEKLRIQIEMAPGGAVPGSHCHPGAEERFVVTAGRVQMKRSGRTSILDVGEAVVVPAGQGHTWGNPFDEPAAIAVDLYPALRMETFFETLFGLASDGLISERTKLPSFLQAVLLLHDFRPDIHTPPGVVGTPVRGLAAMLAPLARARGYQSVYPKYSAPDAP
ncbi:cupin domain-containing protein [Mycolicibacterium stellerae]|uniref:cupin domain-containing protein n=1 Tax=Mycolicibacterium stellerae TaxID=2358193 RepID=UPI001F3EE3E0|nr:cupin domain-containing protein [Mycolicibacterium stellerae]